jgi:hypothetical protein
MIIEVNGLVGEGVLVVPKSRKYDFEVEARGDLDLFVLTSCNRDWTKESAWNVTIEKKGFLGWGTRKIKDKRKVEFSYLPDKLEREGTCPVWLGGFEQQKGRHSWGFIDFKSESETLPATIYCNGETLHEVGVSVCQARNGLVQGIEFETEVVVAPDDSCSIGKSRGTYFEFPIRKGECTYVFRTIKKPRQDHRFTTIGYQKILIRE